jgi:hypothetical protein
MSMKEKLVLGGLAFVGLTIYAFFADRHPDTPAVTQLRASLSSPDGKVRMQAAAGAPELLLGHPGNKDDENRA